MATTDKNFKVKNGLVVEGANGTINGYNILTESQDSQDFIIEIIGGETLITSVDSAQLEVIEGELAIKSGVFDAYGAASTAETNANDYTNTQLQDYTPTSSLDTTIDGYGYLKSDDISGKQDTLTAGSNIDITGTTISVTGLDSEDISDFNTAALSATASAYDISGAASTAQQNAENYTDTALESYTPTSSLDATIDGYGYLKSADLSGYATESYVNTAVDNLVDGAPGLLDTLNEIAAAINDDENYATTITTALAGKQGSLTAGSNIDITNDVISVVNLASTDISDFATAAQSAGTGYFDTIGSAQDVADDLSAHENLSSGVHGVSGTVVGTSDSQTLTNKTIDGSSNTLSNIDNTSLVNYSIDINGYTTNLGSSVTLDTDDVSEGTAQYFTDARAKESAAALITGATKTNIVITGDANGLTITAENGVADSDTDDLVEGTTNRYFTIQRAIDAIQDTTPNFTAVEIDSLAKQVAATVEVATASAATAYSWAKADYRTAKFLVKTAYGTHTDVSEVLLTLDTSDNIAITEYATVGTNGSAMTVSADISGTDVRLRVTTVNNNSTVTVVGTLLA